MILIIGGSGYIGRNLCRYFSKKGKLAGGTYYNSYREGLVYFDLKNPNLKKLEVDINKVEYSFICSAISNIDLCKKNQEEAFKVNVKGTKKILEQLFEYKITPVFLSSDHVFNGEKGNYRESDETNPCNVYGMHKKIIEDFLLGSNEEFLIARISKIFGIDENDETFITSWVKQLRNNEDIHCAYNQRVSATYIGDLANAFDISLGKKLRGLYNIAPPESFSRLKIAKMVKQRLGIKSGRIIPCSIKYFDFLDERPLDTSLNPDKFINETGFKFSKIEDCIDKLK